LSLHYPHGDEVSTAIYSTFIGHPEEVLLKTRADIVANEKHEPSVQIAYFHPAIRELAVSFDAGKTVSHQVLLDLSEDGTRLGPHQFIQLPALATGDR